MIYGNGLIAKSFIKYKKNSKYIFFASGVSNSQETNKFKYTKEIKLLKKILLNKKNNQIFIYFSSCSIFDPSKKNSLYVIAKNLQTSEELIFNNSCQASRFFKCTRQRIKNNQVDGWEIETFKKDQEK